MLLLLALWHVSQARNRSASWLKSTSQLLKRRAQCWRVVLAAKLITILLAWWPVGDRGVNVEERPEHKVHNNFKQNLKNTDEMDLNQTVWKFFSYMLTDLFESVSWNHTVNEDFLTWNPPDTIVTYRFKGLYVPRRPVHIFLRQQTCLDQIELNTCYF